MNDDPIRDTVYQLSATSKWPFEDQGKLALVRAFREAFNGDEIAITSAVEEFIHRAPDDDGRQCPTPYEVWKMAKERGFQLNAKERLGKIAAAQDCGRCGNTGWYEVQIREDEVTVNQWDKAARELKPVTVKVPIMAVLRCTCPLGKAMGVSHA